MEKGNSEIPTATHGDFDRVELAIDPQASLSGIARDEKPDRDEKRDYNVDVSDDGKSSPSEPEALDPYTPFPIDHDAAPEGNILTVRAMLLGCAVGALVNASNLYLGLKTGWTFSANLFGCLVGFAVLKSLSVSPLRIPYLTDHFGPMENNIVQTAATAAGGLGILFVGGIPALYQLGLMSEKPKDDFGRLVAFSFVAAYFGLSFSVPLRKFFIVSVARELNLIYPTATATAVSIRAMHQSGSGLEEAKKKIKALGWAFAVSFTLRVISQYVTGVFWDWHIFWWFYMWGKAGNGAIYPVNWGWFIEWTPAFIGGGFLVGLNAAFSFFFGGVFAWGIVGPSLVSTGLAYGIPASDNYPKMRSYNSMTVKNIDHVSPRYWLLWPGVLGMLVVSMAELAFNYKIIIAGFRAAVSSVKSGIAKISKKGRSAEDTSEKTEAFKEDFPDHEQVPIWMWLSSAVAIVIVTCVVLGIQFQFPVGVSILSLVFAFIFSFLAIQCTGSTDTTPVSTVAKASQLITGGISKGMHFNVQHSQLLNIMAGAVSGGAAGQATDLVNDFKVGYLLRTPPRTQWLAQIMGSMVAVVMAPAMFVLFATAYPCILDREAEHCTFGAPSIAAWRAVAEAVTSPNFPVPKSSGIFSIVYAIISVMISFTRHWLQVKGKHNIAVWLPNMMIFSLALTLPYTQYGTAMAIGALAAHIWQKKNIRTWHIYGIAVASGMIAGEGIGGVINALFQVIGISGDKYGTNWGCPDNQC